MKNQFTTGRFTKRLLKPLPRIKKVTIDGVKYGVIVPDEIISKATGVPVEALKQISADGKKARDNMAKEFDLTPEQLDRGMLRLFDAIFGTKRTKKWN